mgnify:CR=1 FL=1
MARSGAGLPAIQQLNLTDSIAASENSQCEAVTR